MAEPYNIPDALRSAVDLIGSVAIFWNGIPQGGLAYASLSGLANPHSRSQGDRRDKRPAYVSPYVLRREGRRECKAFNYGYILSMWPWLVAQPRS